MEAVTANNLPMIVLQSGAIMSRFF